MTVVRTMAKVTRASLAALTACCLLTAAGCSSGVGVDQENGFAAGDGTYTRIAPDQRKPAPVLSGTTLDGKHLSTADYAGKVIVINIWGSWCAPCRKEAPDLQAASDQTKDVAQFVGLNTRDLDKAPAQAFVRAFNITYPSLFDSTGELLLGFNQVPPTAIPSTILIDKHGRVAARILGATNTTTVVGSINDIAAGK